MVLKTIYFFVFCFLLIGGSVSWLLSLKIDPLVFAPLFMLNLFISITILQEFIFSNKNIFSRFNISLTQLERSWFVKCVMALVIFQFLNLSEQSKNIDIDLFKSSILRIDLIALGFLAFMLYNNYLDWRRVIHEYSKD